MSKSSILKEFGTPSLTPMLMERGEVKITIPYKPRDVFRTFHRRPQRFALTVAHRRAGKTVAAVNDDIKKILSVQRTFPPPQIAFISPTFGQSKRNAWPYAKHYTSGIPGMRPMEGDLTLVFPNGGRYIFAGSDNYDSLRGLYLDHATLDEFGSQDPRVWGEIIRPALSDYAGSATFIGSAHGLNHFHDLLLEHKYDPDWLITILKASETGILSKEELADARKTMTDEQYRQEYECDFEAAVTGTFYGKELELADKENRVRETLLYERGADVFAGWDLGLGGGLAGWTYQRVGQEWHWLDYYEGMTPESALEDAANWIKALPYKVNLHYLPHDAKNKELMLQNKTRQQWLEERGWKTEILPRASLGDGIAMVRVNFNKFFFNRPGCLMGLNKVRMYRSVYDEDKKIFSDKPLHNFASHAADAMRTAVMGMPDVNRRSDWLKPIDRQIAVA